MLFCYVVPRPASRASVKRIPPMIRSIPKIRLTYPILQSLHFLITIVPVMIWNNALRGKRNIDRQRKVIGVFSSSM